MPHDFFLRMHCLAGIIGSWIAFSYINTHRMLDYVKMLYSGAIRRLSAGPDLVLVVS